MHKLNIFMRFGTKMTDSLANMILHIIGNWKKYHTLTSVLYLFIRPCMLFGLNLFRGIKIPLIENPIFYSGFKFIWFLG